MPLLVLNMFLPCLGNSIDVLFDTSPCLSLANHDIYMSRLCTKGVFHFSEYTTSKLS